MSEKTATTADEFLPSSVLAQIKRTASPAREEGPESACVYFGRKRLREVQARAKAAGLAFSSYVNLLMDTGTELSREQVERLHALARVKRTTPLALLGKLIDSATA